MNWDLEASFQPFNETVGEANETDDLRAGDLEVRVGGPGGRNHDRSWSYHVRAGGRGRGAPAGGRHHALPSPPSLFCWYGERHRSQAHEDTAQALAQKI